MSSPFHFKQFSVFQETAPFKVGTDGVLLGAWACKKEPKFILDIGTGTGLISLMLAQRYTNSRIHAIEPESEAFKWALNNIDESPWKNRIKLFPTSLQDFQAPVYYDLIVCNPPFFSNSKLSGKHGKDRARHDHSLRLETIFQFASNQMNPGGSLDLIIPVDKLELANELSQEYNLNLSWICEVFPKPTAKAKRVLLEYRQEKRDLREDRLTIEIERHHYTEEFKALTSAFYLNH